MPEVRKSLDGPSAYRHVEIELVEIDTMLAQERWNELLALRMMDELWLSLARTAATSSVSVFVDITRSCGAKAGSSRLSRLIEGARVHRRAEDKDVPA